MAKQKKRKSVKAAKKAGPIAKAKKKPAAKRKAAKVPSSPECVFCRIVSGEIPAYRIYEDAKTIAFMDINPCNEGHALAIARGHYKDIFETPADVLAAVAQTAQRVARAVQAALSPEGINIVQANGPAAGQSQHHFHIHVLPRRMNDRAKLNWDLSPGDPNSIASMQARIKAKLK